MTVTAGPQTQTHLPRHRPGGSPSALKPVLKWAGGKRWLAADIANLWQQCGRPRLVEPFCGGLAITLALQPEQALLNDINSHVINLYRWLQKGLQIDMDMRNDKAFYYACRDRFNALIADGNSDTGEAAALFYMLNRTGFNGLCRFNRKGFYNVPFGRYKTINYCRDFSAFRPLLQHWQFENRDFAALDIDDRDFIYADPPYDVEFRQYTSAGFDWPEQCRLVDWLLAHEGPVVLSNQATPRIIDLYTRAGFELRYLSAPRMISRNGDRTPAKEILAVRNLPGCADQGK